MTNRKIPEGIRQSIREFKQENPDFTLQQIAEAMNVSYNCALETLQVPRTKTLEERFWSYVDKSAGPDACWPWTGSLRSTGYGQLYVNELKMPTAASRVSLYLQNGAWPIEACHKCDNPPCVNP